MFPCRAFQSDGKQQPALFFFLRASDRPTARGSCEVAPHHGQREGGVDGAAALRLVRPARVCRFETAQQLAQQLPAENVQRAGHCFRWDKGCQSARAVAALLDARPPAQVQVPGSPGRS